MTAALYSPSSENFQPSIYWALRTLVCQPSLQKLHHSPRKLRQTIINIINRLEQNEQNARTIIIYNFLFVYKMLNEDISRQIQNQKQDTLKLYANEN